MPPPLPITNADRARHAVSLIEQGQQKAAERLLKDVLKADANQLDALIAMGVLCGMRGQNSDAVKYLSRAAQRNPASYAAQYNLGQALIPLGRHAEAADALARAIAIDGQPSAHEKRGDALRQLGRLGEALGHYRIAVEKAPGNALAVSSAVETMRKLCDWTGLEPMQRRLVDLARAGHPVEPLLLLHVADDPAIQRRAAEQYWRALVATPPAARLGPRRDRAKLRIGYLSADFRLHPMVSVIAEAMELHDRERFEIWGLSYGRDDGSTQRRRMEKAFDRFLDLQASSEAQMIARIADAGIDILVDLAGYTANARLGVVAARPAPIVCHYMGYPGTLGSPAYDYLIADPVVAPPEAEAIGYTEPLARLPDCFWGVDRKRDLPAAPASRHLHGLPEDAVVLGSLNGQQKLTPGLLDIWSRVLAAVPDAVLWLYADTEEAVANMRRETSARGIPPERAVIAGRVPPDEHLARVALVDLMLDAMPYGGHTTTCDALWMGVPVLTVTGHAFASRVGESLLHAAGMSELIMPTLADYEREAITLASDRTRLAAVRARLADTRATCALFDTQRFTRNLEAAYLEMWARRQRGERPASFTVAAAT